MAWSTYRWSHCAPATWKITFGSQLGSRHAPPHFHARYGGHEVTVRIRDGLVAGKFPPRPLGFVLEWYIRHREKLAENWERARQRRPLRRIDPLE